MNQDTPTKAMATGDEDRDPTPTDLRRYRLETFIESRDSLSANSERQSAFLIGALVGMVSNHQQRKREMNRTVVDQYPPDRITLDRLVTAWPDLVQKCAVYAKDVEWTDEPLFPELLDREEDVLTHPGEWDLSLQDIRFFYALGVTYGLRADYRAYELGQDIEANEPETNVA